MFHPGAVPDVAFTIERNIITYSKSGCMSTAVVNRLYSPTTKTVGAVQPGAEVISEGIGGKKVGLVTSRSEIETNAAISIIEVAERINIGLHTPEAILKMLHQDVC